MKLIALIPNLLSFLRILLTPVFAWFFMQQSHDQQLTGVIIFTLAALSDTFDGYLARRFHVTSSYGAFLDPLADKFLVLTGFACLYARSIVSWWLIAAIVGRDIAVTWFRVHAACSGKKFTTSWQAKAKTVAQFLALGAGAYAALWPSYQIDMLLHWLMPVVALFTLYTGYGYAKTFCRML
jgi:CDP-diacylglycerol--glycerol-3-phosphate 3-phosphatidyltransferase